MALSLFGRWPASVQPGNQPAAEHPVPRPPKERITVTIGTNARYHLANQHTVRTVFLVIESRRVEWTTRHSTAKIMNLQATDDSLDHILKRLPSLKVPVEVRTHLIRPDRIIMIGPPGQTVTIVLTSLDGKKKKRQNQLTATTMVTTYTEYPLYALLSYLEGGKSRSCWCRKGWIFPTRRILKLRQRYLL